ncbi:ATP-binding protein [uncultured Erythrobacter sp.]|uniref:AlbA family DNA-binding domain-containing protein n=1 Tax=uncultured Erythrobacter sp. TaxID=263913 RepID=UPI002602283B|nr:ATP-binding protein [uncultured Erythrobacter sp.]
MISEPLEAIGTDTLDRLIANGVAENRTLEYKRDLPNPKDKDSKREFLADVTSFANSQGGDLLYGIDAPRGIPTAIAELSIDDPDAELRRWEDIIQSGVEPRIPGLHFRWIAYAEGRGVLLIRVPPSPVGPHRIIFGNWSRFFSRRSNAKYEMDTHELREAFVAGEALPNRIHSLHLQAVEAAVRGDLPVGLGDDPKAIVSLVPMTYFRERRDLDIKPENALAPIKPSGYMDSVEMIEGVLLHTNPSESGAVRSYAITYRQGRIDVVWTIGRVVHELRKVEAPIVWPKRFEDGVLDAAISGVARLQPFGIEGPWTVHASLTGIRNYHLVVNNEYWSDPAWRDQVTLPSLRVEMMNRAALIPLLRSFWLAFGIRRPENPFNT